MVAGCMILAGLLAACGDDGGSGGSGPGGGGTGGATTTSSSAGGGSGVCTPGEAEACAAYTGPAGTEGVGVCVASRRVCLADGSGFGACGDEVLPSLENCATVGDDDCDGSAPACTLTHLWSRGVVGTGQDEITDVAVDGDGNVVVVGYSNGPIDLGGGSVGQAGDYRCFVAKYGPTGAHLWSHHYPGFGRAFCQAVRTDQAGNVYVAGDIDGTIDFGGGQLSSIGINVTDIVVAKLDPSGAHLWSRRYGNSSSSERAFGMALDAQDRPMVVGRFNGYAELGGQGVNAMGGTDALVMALDADGGVRWVRGFGGTGPDSASRVRVAPNGEIVVGGDFSETVDFGGGPIVSHGSRDAFVLKLDSSGAHLASLGFGGENWDWTSDVELAPDGDIYISASVTLELAGMPTPFEFAGQTLNGLGREDQLIARLDPSLTPRWARVQGGPEQDRAVSLRLDASGNLTVAGFFRGSASFGGSTFTTTHPEVDIVLAKYDPSGAHIVSVRFGGEDAEGPSSITIDHAGNAVVTGWYMLPFSFGGSELPSGGTYDVDAFIAKFSP